MPFNFGHLVVPKNPEYFQDPLNMIYEYFQEFGRLGYFGKQKKKKKSEIYIQLKE